VARYKPNEKNFQKLLMGKPAYKAAHRKARVGKNILESVAPVDSGEYLRSIHLEFGVVPKRRRANARVAFWIVADAPHAAAIEFGNKHIKNPPRPMQKTLEALRAMDRHKGR